MARILQVLDASVIALSLWVYGLDSSLYAVVGVILSGYVADRVLAGRRDSGLAFIVSEKYREIGEEVLQEMDRGAPCSMRGECTRTRRSR